MTYKYRKDNLINVFVNRYSTQGFIGTKSERLKEMESERESREEN